MARFSHSRTNKMAFIMCVVLLATLVDAQNIGSVITKSDVKTVNIMREMSVGNYSAWERDGGSKMAWIRTLFDHHDWDKHLDNVTASCKEDILTYVTALNRGQLWASKMYDASGHYSQSLLFGNDFMLGSMNACKDLQLKQYYKDLPPYIVSFHVARFNLTMDDGHIPLSRTILLGTCLPSSCSADDISAIFRSGAAFHVDVAKKENLGAKILMLNVRPVPGPYTLLGDSNFVALGSITLIILVLMIVASFYEGYIERLERLKATVPGEADVEMSAHNNNGDLQHNNNVNCKTVQTNGKAEIQVENERKCQVKSILIELLLSFSMLSNGRKILCTKSDSSEATLTCIHGLRFFSVIWVIMVHTYLSLFSIADNKQLRTVTERNFMYQSVGNASYSVDTFFCISGVLVTILFLRQEERDTAKRRSKAPLKKEETKTGYTNSAMTDSSQSVISHFERDLMESSKKITVTKKEFFFNLKKFLLLFLYRLIRLTPAYWFVIGLNEIAMRHIHNNSVFDAATGDHITCDLYWWRNILYINNLYPLREMCMVWSWYMANDTQFYVIGVILLLISVRFLKFSLISGLVLMISSWITTIYISWSYQYKARIQDPFEMFDPLYDKPWSRLGPYLIGMITGWYLHVTRAKIAIPYWVSLICWPTSVAIMGLLIFGMVDGFFEVWPTVFYVSIGHTGWGVAVAWITIACCTGHGGIVNSILSYGGLLPLSRLTYCAYLVHPIIMIYYSYHMDGPVHLQQSMLTAYAGFAVMSFVLSFAISLAYEAPVVRLMKVTIEGNTRRKDSR